MLEPMPCAQVPAYEYLRSASLPMPDPYLQPWFYVTSDGYSGPLLAIALPEGGLAE